MGAAVTCLGTKLPKDWWRQKDILEREINAHGGFLPASVAHDGKPSDNTLRKWWNAHKLPQWEVPYWKRGGLTSRHTVVGRTTAPGRGQNEPVKLSDAVPDDTWLLDVLKKLGDKASIDDLADAADVSPRRVREARERLGGSGYLIEESAGSVAIDRAPRPSESAHKILFAGDVYRFGIASDAHLNSTHCRLEELHIAYDRFKAEGIDTVYNPGDIVAGRGIFRGQDHEIINHTFESQKAYAIENYPVRPGIVTKIISGNHDCEGDFGRAGADACLGVANERDDIEWCGRYAADFILPNGAVMTMRHPMGGSSYAKSYKPQKFAESFEGGSKPNIVLFGHWHNMLYLIARNIHMLNCGTFEGGGNSLSTRVPLGEPAVGFFIVEATIGGDGSVVRFRPEWFPLFAGRKIA